MKERKDIQGSNIHFYKELLLIKIPIAINYEKTRFYLPGSNDHNAADDRL